MRAVKRFDTLFQKIFKKFLFVFLLDELSQNALYIIYVDRLCNMRVHAAFEAFFYVVAERVGGHGDYRQILIRMMSTRIALVLHIRS